MSWYHMNMARTSLNDETKYRVLRLLESNPELSQREVARILGVSLGKVNHCVKALIQKGWVKVSNFKNSRNKLGYTYLLTRTGIEEKSELTVRFLQRKMREYEALQLEIQQLRKEANGRN